MSHRRIGQEGNHARRQHWYFIVTEECVLCGRGDTWRQRMFTPKPSDPAERHKFQESACPEHFL